ncbi:MAG: ParB/RepB/Spo0J family partition protein [Acidimicrobiia bacterium]|nr:ParB/RepB/Spo0J family partition protein [Acidimicrobiia bacterium]
MAERRPALGKGLSALIPGSPPEPRAGVLEVDIDRLAPNEDQPRVQMDDQRLEDLARSIRGNGIIQPILVRRSGEGYRIIAGERRWRAAQRAGLLKVPVIVRDLGDDAHRDALQLALIENIQREDLNCMDEAAAYQRLADEFGLTQEQIAAAVGRERSTVANYLRLLKLPVEIHADLATGALTMGHARALLALGSDADQRAAAREAISRHLSVRDTEALVRRMGSESRSRPAAPASPADVHTRAAEDRLRFALGTKVRITRRGTGGTIEVAFTSEAELDRLYRQLTS